jgi:hypothetical protein
VRLEDARRAEGAAESVNGLAARRLADIGSSRAAKLLQSHDFGRTYAHVSHKEKVADPAPSRWTRPDDYLGALARKRTFRRAHEPKVRTQPERPRALLSTIPFLALLALLGVLAVAIMIVAFPGSQPVRTEKAVPHEQGVAQRGWFQEAQKEMHR